MDDQFDVDLVDHALLEELELTTELIVAASESEPPLSGSEIDRILGVSPPPLVPRPRSGKRTAPREAPRVFIESSSSRW